jgi:FHS family glucose/mannose:H+ symporter-like MFS transporter
LNRNEKRLLLPSYLGMLGIGMANSLPGTVLPKLTPVLGLSLADGGRLVSVTYIGIMLLMLITHHLTAWFGRKRLILFNPLLQIAGTLLIATAASKIALAAGIVLLGLGFGLQGAVLNGLFAQLFADSPGKIGGLNSMFGLGGLVLAGSLYLLSLFSLPWTWVYTLGIAVNLLTLLLFIGVDLPPEEMPTSGSERRQVLPWSSLVGLVAFFVTYAGAEVTMGGLLGLYLTESGRATPAIAALAVGFYWGTLAVGRLVLAPLVNRLGARRFL